MKTKYLIVSALWLLSLSINAQNYSFKPQICAFLEYGYNYTWAHYGNAELQVNLPVNPYFEANAMTHLSTANVYSFAANARPQFPLSVGKIYLETKFTYRAIVRNQMQDLSAAFSIGYQMDYVRFQIGTYSKMFAEFNRNLHSNTEIFIEAPSLLYALEIWVRPQDNPRNINLRIANYNDYSIERMWQPLFALGGKYSLNNNLAIIAEAELKPTGMFHLDASFYGITTRAGIAYQF